MHIPLPSYLSKRDMLWLSAALFFCLICAMLFEGYRASQRERLDEDLALSQVTVEKLDTKALDRLVRTNP